MSVFGNRIKVNTATTGTGTLTLGAASSNAFCTFAEAGIANAATVTYCIEEGTDFEIGTGVYTTSGTTLTRASVLISKIAGTAGTTKMTLAGAATVRVILAAEDIALAATQTDQETSTSTTVFTNPGVQQFHPSACKFWVKFGVTTTISASYNMTSITDTAAGKWTATIATDFSSANWCLSYSILCATVTPRIPYGVSQTAGAITLETTDTAGGTVDPVGNNVAGFGDQ